MKRVILVCGVIGAWGVLTSSFRAADDPPVREADGRVALGLEGTTWVVQAANAIDRTVWSFLKGGRVTFKYDATLTLEGTWEQDGRHVRVDCKTNAGTFEFRGALTVSGDRIELKWTSRNPVGLGQTVLTPVK